MNVENKQGIANLLFVVGFSVVMIQYLFVSFILQMKYQEAKWQGLDQEIAAAHPCGHTVSTWLTRRECLPPLGDYRHALYLPDAICAQLVGHDFQWRGMQCANP